MSQNGFSIGRFGFFRDAELTMRLSDDNLYDQVGPDGWVNVWLGGRDIYLPEYGDFSVYLTSEQGFFWDIIDQNGNRTKDGFESMFIPYNPHMEPHSGDSMPADRSELFNQDAPTPKLICSNLWFYNNLFRDEYYRYNLIVLNSATSNGWPDEANAKIVPMNDTLTLEAGDYIVGYRPKPEYMNQLAVVRKMVSGVENSIMFKFKVDLEYMAQNPTEKRFLRVFTTSSDTAKFLVYPDQVEKVEWGQHSVPFMSEYNRFLLYHGIQKYSPSDAELRHAKDTHDKFMAKSNLVLQMDSLNMEHVIDDVTQVLAGEDVKIVGYSHEIIPLFVEWFYENKKIDVPEKTDEILRRIVLTNKYYKGFSMLAAAINSGIDDPDAIDYAEGIPTQESSSPEINIIMVDGVRMFENGYVPTSANEYRYPTGDYRYSGETGNGLYKIRVAGRDVDVFCGMEEIVAHTEITELDVWDHSYSNNENVYREYDSGNPDDEIKIDFDGSTESCCDHLRVYNRDGDTLLTLSGNLSGESISVPGGYAKLGFSSDGSVVGHFIATVQQVRTIEDTEGGWMYLIVGPNNMGYVSNLADVTPILSTKYTDDTYGIGWGQNDGNPVSLQFYNMPFSHVRVEPSGDYNNPENGKGYLEMHTGAQSGIIYFTDSDASGEQGQQVIVDGVSVLANNKTDLTNYVVQYDGDNDGMNNLVVKMFGDSDAPYCRRFIKMLAVR